MGPGGPHGETQVRSQRTIRREGSGHQSLAHQFVRNRPRLRSRPRTAGNWSKKASLATRVPADRRPAGFAPRWPSRQGTASGRGPRERPPPDRPTGSRCCRAVAPRPERRSGPGARGRTRPAPRPARTPSTSCAAPAGCGTGRPTVPSHRRRIARRRRPARPPRRWRQLRRQRLRRWGDYRSDWRGHRATRPRRRERPRSPDRPGTRNPGPGPRCSRRCRAPGRLRSGTSGRWDRP